MVLGMSGQYSFSMASTISQTQTIVPRLDYSQNLMSHIIQVLKIKKNQLKKSNKQLLEYEENDLICLRAIDVERRVSYSLETLSHIQKKMQSVSRIDSIPKTFPSIVPVLRTLSAQLVDIHPESSQHLSELSVHLGSIVLDSAAITKAQFDFVQSSQESSTLLDEVKLMVDSKINKQYAHLDFFTVLGN
jgi:hypothetical protein